MINTPESDITPAVPSAPDVDTFIDKWSRSGAAERANYQLFLSELCRLLGVPGPEPTQDDDQENTYVFERWRVRRLCKGRDSMDRTSTHSTN